MIEYNNKKCLEGENILKEMRRKDREIDRCESLEILTKGEYGIISTIGVDNYPYGLPLSYTYFNDSIYFHCAKEGHKLDNINHNEKVSFCVVGKTEVLRDKFSTKYESTIVFGKCVEVCGDEKTEALSRLIDKYSPEFKIEGLKYIEKESDRTKVYKIEIDKITGKSRK